MTCVLSSDFNIPNTTAQIMLIESRTSDSESASENIATWKGDLKAGEPVSFSTKIIFKRAGKWAIEASARHVVDEKNSYGDIDVIYLTVGADQSTFGWPRERVALVQEKKGDVEGVESSQEEPRVEELPEPPSVSVDGIVEETQEHHSITVTGTFKYWTKSGDYRLNPDVKVPAEYFLVELLSGSGSHKAYGYTNSAGYFSISGVDPSGGIKARLWCYVKYSPNDYELRVVDSILAPLTGLTNVWHSGYTSTYYFPDDGSAHSIGTYTYPKGANGDGAFWIKDDLDRAFLYPPDPPDQPGPGTACWTEDSIVGSFYIPGEKIYLKGVDERAPLLTHMILK